MTAGLRHPKIVVVACVLLSPDGSILLAKRPEGRTLAGLWEFPGGKVEPGEEPEAALLRELEEELGVRLRPENLVPLTSIDYPYPDFDLVMPLYLCEAWDGEITAREDQELVWTRPDQLDRYAMPPADEPLKRTLAGLLQSKRS